MSATLLGTIGVVPFDQRGLTEPVLRNVLRLLDVVAAMSVRLRWRDMPERGRYYDRQALIELNPRMRGVEVVQTLGHEIAHAMFGDVDGTPAQEERADRVGSAIAVDPVQFRAARLAGRKRPASFGTCPRGFDRLEAAPHAERGCPCPSCQHFRDTVIAELIRMGAQHREIISRYGSAADAEWDTGKAAS